MNRLAIVVGDMTDHGGHVMTGSESHIIDGFPTAHVGCDVICPLHGPTKIISGQNDYLVEGHPLALEGDLTTCGARLVSCQQNFFLVERESSSEHIPVTPPMKRAYTPVVLAQPYTSSTSRQNRIVCDERFQMLTHQRNRLGHLDYVLLEHNQCTARGTLDEHGHSRKHGSSSPSTLQFAASAPWPVME
ncbi:PAAR domain-containing protein [Pseudomonas avellanae]|uniref:PAAR domain-containing protein n=1 Tax=Pseudomonas avellanae TaxID=46257 RepID=A0A3M5TXP8_9PSED|nr:PAAR domain-containing protein [Pseudomonas avellanae]RMU38370.1 hypothetical protein ALP32_03790 [Pseudomonas avellanae]UQW68003.1 PAAR domain-containing protein [Pseudomonas avellanae]UQW73985.1 PAAR domain-containing protein [Pseudomonas avellanae]GGJ21266.1 hypothetical protein GCM10009085_14350 [Pseudomonas avellanae]